MVGEHGYEWGACAFKRLHFVGKVVLWHWKHCPIPSSNDPQTSKVACIRMLYQVLLFPQRVPPVCTPQQGSGANCSRRASRPRCFASTLGMSGVHRADAATPQLLNQPSHHWLNQYDEPGSSGPGHPSVYSCQTHTARNLELRTVSDMRNQTPTTSASTPVVSAVPPPRVFFGLMPARPTYI